MKDQDLIARVRELDSYRKKLNGEHATASLADSAPLLAEALERALADQQWKPIETAPRDGGRMGLGGCRILAWCPDWDDTFIVKWSPNRPAPHWTVDSGAVVESAPTHWMPLSNPPTK